MIIIVTIFTGFFFTDLVYIEIYDYAFTMSFGRIGVSQTGQETVGGVLNKVKQTLHMYASAFGAESSSKQDALKSTVVGLGNKI